MDYPDWNEGFGEPPEPERPRDAAIDRAKEAIREVVGERSGEVFYGRQLEIMLERDFYHWITGFAAGELVDEGALGSEKVELERGSNVRIKFIFAPTHRYRKRQIKLATAVIREFSRPEIGRACGVQAEVLFELALLKRGFGLRGENVRGYGGKVWTMTDHNLDFILERDGQAYGVEVKNRLDYIDREELRIKLALCRYLGLRPLFIMRAAAKSYNYEVIEQGGFALIFHTQIYPPGQEKLVELIRNALQLPVVCSRAIPDGIVDRFVRWHEGRVGKV